MGPRSPGPEPLERAPLAAAMRRPWVRPLLSWPPGLRTRPPSARTAWTRPGWCSHATAASSGDNRLFELEQRKAFCSGLGRTSWGGWGSRLPLGSAWLGLTSDQGPSQPSSGSQTFTASLGPGSPKGGRPSKAEFPSGDRVPSPHPTALRPAACWGAGVHPTSILLCPQRKGP